MKSGRIVHCGRPGEITSEIRGQVWECAIPAEQAGVEPRGGLVQDQYPRVVQHGLGDSQPLLHAAGRKSGGRCGSAQSQRSRRTGMWRN